MLLKRSHGDIYVYLELYKQKRRADDELEFSCVSLKANSLKTGINIKMTVFAFWFDSNKEQHYPFFVIRGSRFFNDFTTRVNSYIHVGTTIVVPDSQYPVCVCLCMCLCVCVCVCVCVLLVQGPFLGDSRSVHVKSYCTCNPDSEYTFVFVCVCMCARVSVDLLQWCDGLLSVCPQRT